MITVLQMERALRDAAEDLIAREEELSRLDSYVGDGDHGTTIRQSFQKIRQQLGGLDQSTMGELFQCCTLALMDTAGGAIGPILASMFMGFSEAAGDCPSLDSAQLAAMFRKGLDGVQDMGGAKPGDRTLVDPLNAAVEALEGNIRADEGAALHAAAQAAYDGAMATAKMIARHGRAKNLGEASLGYVDAGAMTMYYFIRAMEQSIRASAPAAFRYYVPTDIRFGPDVRMEAGRAAAIFGKRVLLVTGIPAGKLRDEVIEALEGQGLSWYEVNGVEPNPKITTVERGAQLCREKAVDVVLALGGGSTIDCAKGICAAARYSGQAWDLVLDGGRIRDPLPLVTIPTLSASGSEMGNAAVLTNPDTREKLLMLSDALFPRISLLDPVCTFTLPRGQTAAGTADIFIHAAEEYFDWSDQEYLTDGITEAVMRTCVRYGRRAMDEPDCYEARANLMWAAPLAINGLLNCGRRSGWTLHGIQHPLGGYYNVTHGAALAVLMPHWMERILHAGGARRLARYGSAVFGLPGDNEMETACQAIRKTRELFFDQLELPSTLGQLGVDDAHLEEMARDAVRHLNSPYCPVTEQMVVDLYKAAL